MARPSDQALAVPVEPALRLGPAGFDPSRGEDVCMRCGRPNPNWFAPHEVWNFVIGGPEAKGDPGGFLCPNCFILLAAAIGLRGAWELRPSRALPRRDGYPTDVRRRVSSCATIVLDTLRSHSPMTVGRLRPIVEAAMRRSVHEKTPGVALQRLAKQGLVRNEGRKWFAIATEARRAETENTDSVHEGAGPQGHRPQGDA